jgi:hypothetical protein
MTATAGALRAVGELTRGIVLTGSVQLTNAARLFCRDPAELAVAVRRICLHLKDRRWDHQAWASAILAEQVRHIEPDSLIPIDATELAKPYAKHMQYQCTVRDASRPGDPLVPGYWCWGAYHWQAEHDILNPLMLRPYSTRQPYFLSENDQWRSCLRALYQATGGKGIWLHDRGADRPEIFTELLDLKVRWIVRVREDRPLVGPDGATRSAGVWADWALAHQPERGHAVTCPVRLAGLASNPFRGQVQLWLVVPTYRFADGDRWVLLTRGLIDQHVGPRQVRHDYAIRWRAEDAKRFLGQLWHVERFLTRSFLALERLLHCVVAAGGFLATLQRDWPELAQSLQAEVIYWNKPVKVPGYRLARGVIGAALQHGPLPVLVNA